VVFTVPLVNRYVPEQMAQENAAKQTPTSRMETNTRLPLNRIPSIDFRTLPFRVDLAIVYHIRAVFRILEKHRVTGSESNEPASLMVSPYLLTNQT
jgi:hypothetical protein